MSQKSSLPQAAKAVSHVLMSDTSVIVSSVFTSVLLHHGRGAPSVGSKRGKSIRAPLQRRVIEANIGSILASCRGRPNVSRGTLEFHKPSWSLTTHPWSHLNVDVSSLPSAGVDLGYRTEWSTSNVSSAPNATQPAKRSQHLARPARPPPPESRDPFREPCCPVRRSSSLSSSAMRAQMRDTRCTFAFLLNRINSLEMPDSGHPIRQTL
jgi:hypothetical protein